MEEENIKEQLTMHTVVPCPKEGQSPIDQFDRMGLKEETSREYVGAVQLDHNLQSGCMEVLHTVELY